MRCASPPCIARFRYYGALGWRDLAVRYFDPSGGAARFKLLINGQVVDEWVADDLLPSNKLDAHTSSRRLVTGGPYRLVRHPLYAAEIVAAVAFAMVNPGALVVVILAPFIATQLLRSRFEERLLTEAYPEYTEYARHTRRLIPFVW